MNDRIAMQKIVIERVCRRCVYNHVNDMRTRDFFMDMFFTYIDDIREHIMDYHSRNFGLPDDQWIWENIFCEINPNITNNDNGRQPELGDISLVI